MHLEVYLQLVRITLPQASAKSSTAAKQRGTGRRSVDTEKAGGRYKLRTSVYDLRSNPCSSVRTLRYVYNWLQRRLLGNGGCRATVREKTQTSVMPTAFIQCARFRAVAVGISRNCHQGRKQKFILEGVFSSPVFPPFLLFSLRSGPSNLARESEERCKLPAGVQNA